MPKLIRKLYIKEFEAHLKMGSYLNMWSIVGPNRIAYKTEQITLDIIKNDYPEDKDHPYTQRYNVIRYEGVVTDIAYWLYHKSQGGKMGNKIWVPGMILVTIDDLFRYEVFCSMEIKDNSFPKPFNFERGLIDRKMYVIPPARCKTINQKIDFIDNFKLMDPTHFITQLKSDNSLVYHTDKHLNIIDKEKYDNFNPYNYDTISNKSR